MLFDYDKQQDDELDLKVGMIVQDVKQVRAPHAPLQSCDCHVTATIVIWLQSMSCEAVEGQVIGMQFVLLLIEVTHSSCTRQ